METKRGEEKVKRYELQKGGTLFLGYRLRHHESRCYLTRDENGKPCLAIESISKPTVYRLAQAAAHDWYLAAPAGWLPVLERVVAPLSKFGCGRVVESIQT